MYIGREAGRQAGMHLCLSTASLIIYSKKFFLQFCILLCNYIWKKVAEPNSFLPHFGPKKLVFGVHSKDFFEILRSARISDVNNSRSSDMSDRFYVAVGDLKIKI